MEQSIIGGHYNALHTTNTEYTALFGGYNWSSSEVFRYQLASTDGVLKNLFVELNDVPGTGTYTFTVRLNGAPTGLTCTVAADGTTASDVNQAHNVTITGGDRLTLECNPDSPDTARYARWSVMFEGDNAKESLLLGGSSDSLANGSTEYAAILGMYNQWDTTEDTHRQVIPTAGKIKNLYIWLDEDPGTSPDGYTFTLRLNGADGLDGGNPLEVAIVANNTTGFDTTHEITVSAGDVVTLESEPISSPSATPSAAWGMTFVADTDGESIIMSGMEDRLDQTATEYAYLTNPYRSVTFDWTGAESERYQLSQECILKNLYVLLDGTPGSGKSYTFTVRRNGTSPVDGLVVIIQNLETAGNDTARTIAVSDFNELNMMSVPGSTPTVRRVYWGLVSSIVAPAPDPPTNVAATENQSGKVVITWDASDGANQYQVKRDTVGLGWLGDVATYDDSAADAPLITAGDSVAGDGASTAHVSLSLDGTSVANGTTHTYVVEARLDGGGSSGDSGSDTGYRQASAITYQWQRSDGDADGDYNTNLGTASTYDDTGAPAPTITAGSAAATDGLTAYVTLSLAGESANVGAGRYYQCVLVSTNASNTPATATANRGYRGVGGLVYKWQVSDADSDAAYNTDITGGSTDPFNYEVTHIDGRYYRCYLTATGASADTSAVDRGWRKPLAVADGDLIGIGIIRKS